MPGFGMPSQEQLEAVRREASEAEATETTRRQQQDEKVNGTRSSDVEDMVVPASGCSSTNHNISNAEEPEIDQDDDNSKCCAGKLALPPLDPRIPRNFPQERWDYITASGLFNYKNEERKSPCAMCCCKNAGCLWIPYCMPTSTCFPCFTLGQTVMS